MIGSEKVCEMRKLNRLHWVSYYCYGRSSTEASSASSAERLVLEFRTVSLPMAFLFAMETLDIRLAAATTQSSRTSS